MPRLLRSLARLTRFGRFYGTSTIGEQTPGANNYSGLDVEQTARSDDEGLHVVVEWYAGITQRCVSYNSTHFHIW